VSHEGPASEVSATPRPQTEALQRFLTEERSLIGLITFFGHLVTRADEMAVIAAKALLNTPDLDGKDRVEELEATVEEGGAGIRKLMQKEFANLFTEIVFQRAVDNFIVYISELLRHVFAERPEALSSSETVRIAEVIKCSTMDELVQGLVERRVERLAYLSLADLQDDLVKTLGLRLFDDPDDLARAVRLVAMRNLIAHNRAIVNERYLKQVPSSPFPLGDPLRLNADAVLDDFLFLSVAAGVIDASAIEHFRLTVAE
jgi:hypothetical protein